MQKLPRNNTKSTNRAKTTSGRKSAVRKAGGGDTNFSGFMNAMMAAGEGYNKSVTMPYNQSLWIQTCVRKRASGVRSLPWKIVDAKDREIKSGPMMDFLKRPNAKMTWKEFAGEAVGHYLVTGETDFITLDYRGNKPACVYPINGAQMVPFISGIRVSGWQANLLIDQAPETNIQNVILTTADVHQMKRWNPYSAIRGLSPWEAVKMAVNANYKAEVFSTVAMDNNISASGILTAQELTTEQEDQIKAQIMAKYAGILNARMPMILAGGLKWEEVLTNVAKAMPIELADYTREEICMAYDTPLTFLGTTEDANRSNMIEVQEMWYHGALLPDCEILQDKVTEFLLQPYGDYYLKINHEAHPIARKLLLNTLDGAKKFFDMGVPVADINSTMALGLPDRPWYDRGFRPVGLVDAESENSLGPDLAEGDTQFEEPAVPDKNPKEPPVKSLTDLEEKALTALKGRIFNRWKSSWTPLENKWKWAMHRYFARQKNEMIDRLEKVAARYTIQDNGPAKGKSFEQFIVKGIIPEEEILTILLDVREETGKLKAIVTPLIGESASFGASQIAAEVGLNRTFGIEDPLSISAMKNRWPKLANTNAYTNAWVKETLDEGYQKGETVAQLAQRIQDNKSFSGARSMNIARTETAGAVNEGRLGGIEAIGVTGKSWLDSGKANVRPAHSAATKRYKDHPIPTREAFDVGGERMMYPGDPAGSAANVCQCCCCLLPKILKSGKIITLAYFADYVFLSFSSYLSMKKGAA